MTKQRFCRTTLRLVKVTPVAAICLVPSYMYPSAGGTAWNTFIAHPMRSTKVGRIMILNPNSGPGKEAKTDYRNMSRQLNAQAIKSTAMFRHAMAKWMRGPWRKRFASI